MGLQVVFFGTPDPAARVLGDLLSSSHGVVAVVTAPDRPAGRGLELKQPQVKKAASEASIEVIQPTTLKDEDMVSRLRSLEADVFVVVAYGLIFPAQVLEIPRLGCVNVHFSLLPALRGAAPVQWAIIRGDPKTGVTIMKMDEGLDTGPILFQSELEIGARETAGQLMTRLTALGGEALVRTLDLMEEGDIVPLPQDDSLATVAPKLNSADARIDWELSAKEIERRIRALSPDPGAWTTRNGKRVKIWQARVVPEAGSIAGGLANRDGEMVVATREGGLLVLELQPEGSSRMTSTAYLRGHAIVPGERLE
ncbi:MAG: methionyl-tRNA formyltransferase [Actinobacteria bacterium]|nr:methionyl-tRNA formyltransferase [Actinomycetota bacterium]